MGYHAKKGECSVVRLMKQAFTQWAQSHLKQRSLQITDLQKDFKDGYLLCNLMEIISSKKIAQKYVKEPKLRVQMVQNVNIALQFIQSEDIKLVGCGAEDIVDENLNLIMGLIWTLISHYQISLKPLAGETKKGASAKDTLMEWVKTQVKDFPDIEIQNFHTRCTNWTFRSTLQLARRNCFWSFNPQVGPSVTRLQKIKQGSLKIYIIFSFATNVPGK